MYRLTDNLTNVEEVTGAQAGFLFSNECYCVDVIGPNHRYLLLWTGYRLLAEQLSHTRTALNVLTGGESSTNISKVTIQNGHEDEAFMQFFKNGVIILAGDHRPVDDWKAQVEQQGTMFRI